MSGYNEGFAAGQRELAETILHTVVSQWGNALVPDYVRAACAAVMDGESIPPMKTRTDGGSSPDVSEDLVSELAAELAPEEALAEPDADNAAPEAGDVADILRAGLAERAEEEAEEEEQD